MMPGGKNWLLATVTVSCERICSAAMPSRIPWAPAACWAKSGWFKKAKAHYRQQRQRQGLGDVAQLADDPAHTRVVGRARRAEIALAALPGHIGVKRAESGDEEVVEVEIVGAAGFHGVKQGGVGGGVLDGGVDDDLPVEEEEEQVNADQDEDNIDEESLDKIGDHHRDLAAD